MKGNEKLIVVLNLVLTDELTVVNQYTVHAEICANWRYAKLYPAIREQTMDKMQCAQIPQMGLGNYLFNQTKGSAS